MQEYKEEKAQKLSLAEGEDIDEDVSENIDEALAETPEEAPEEFPESPLEDEDHE